MKREPSGFTVWITFSVLLIFLAACGAPTQSEPVAGTTGTVGDTTGAASTVANITITATPSTITTGETSSIQATVTTSAGANVADGTSIKFSVSNSSYGTITSSATTASGIATATFTAASVPGTVTITATSGSISQTVAVIISAPATGSITFVSASPQVIGIKGSGQSTTSTVTFSVKDVNGNSALDGITVNFTMNGPSGGKQPSSGGEYIGSDDGTPTTATASTSGGNAKAILNTGSVAGPVTITASVTVGAQIVSASSAVISIGGGVPSARHFNLATTKFNLPGLIWSGREETISAYIADRFGNYNVLEGTAVSFYTEAGAIDRQGIMDATGKTSVTVRTQSPMPPDIIRASAGGTVSTAYFGGINEPYYTSGSSTYNPRDGWVAVLATVQGEEAFNDANGNGLYDTGETFTDLGEPFYDKNDDGCYNNGTTKNCSGTVSASTDPFEEYIDADGDGSYDAPNDVWDGPGCADSGCQTSKMIWDDIRLVFSGDYSLWPSPDANNCYNTSSEDPSCNATWGSACFAVSPASITKGSSGSFTVIIGDLNLNRLPGGTKIEASSSTGTVFPSSTDLVDGLSRGPSSFSFSVDIDADSTKNSATVGITVTDTDTNESSCYTSVPLVAAPLIITTSSLPSGTVGAAYSFTLTATGGTEPYTWTSGALPAGLSLDSSSGAISGTPAGPAGSSSITFTVYDSTGDSTSKSLSLTIN